VLFSRLQPSSILDLPLVDVVEFLRGGGLSVVAGEGCCFGRRNLNVLPNLDYKCWNTDFFVAW